MCGAVEKPQNCIGAEGFCGPGQLVIAEIDRVLRLFERVCEIQAAEWQMEFAVDGVGA